MAITKKQTLASQLKLADKLCSKSKLTEKDAKELAEEVDKRIAQRWKQIVRNWEINRTKNKPRAEKATAIKSKHHQ